MSARIRNVRGRVKKLYHYSQKSYDDVQGSNDKRDHPNVNNFT